jgi:AraC-like DNA-binding protein
MTKLAATGVWACGLSSKPARITTPYHQKGGRLLGILSNQVIATPDSILKLARSIPRPTNDYVGVSGHLTGLPFQIVIFSRQPRINVSPDFHYRFLLIIVLNGAGEVIIDGVAHSVSSGQRILVQPFAQHSYAHHPGAEPLECLFIGFEAPFQSEIPVLHGQIQNCDHDNWCTVQAILMHWLTVSKPDRWHAPYTLANSEVALSVGRLLEHSLNQLDACAGSTRADMLAVSQRTTELLWSYARNASPAPIKQDDGSYCLKDGLSVGSVNRGSIAKRLGVSESSLRDSILSCANISPRNFVRRVRLQRAGMWLLEYGFSVQDVARNAGYGESSAFSNEFKKEFGLRPSALLKQHDASEKNPERRFLYERLAVQPVMALTPEADC